MDFKSMAEKIVPTILFLIVGALFTMYMDVQFLKATAVDYKQRADKIHDKFEKSIDQCLKDDIILQKDVEYLRYVK